jgi:hypothetical protein
MAADVVQSMAAMRAADALLRSAGGREVLLRTPLPATPGDAAEQLGLAVPTFQDTSLAPVVFRTARPALTAGKGARWELVVSATAVERVVGSLDFDSASVLFAQAFGVLIDDTLYEIESATSSEIFGSPYVYRLMLRAPLVQLT